ncbi:D-methionine transport system ATP-binding protein [Peribacillus deserti]|uniref:D-methionine transport system ATP-binding protein n=1 Tax=Peribacillus deserti TaxID=673318 RepID=A0ABS2QJ35_9BACI|nr:methionine ABC transporter ATP-binding protein [Peribacillus deserti]MBM7693144.1 D-methionine transport system ATP-binding protein [Peribacillus deserti]
MIVLENIRKIYGSGTEQVEALKSITLNVKKGEIYGVVGFSGAGKSSLIRCVNLLEKPASGKVLINGVDIQALKPSELRQQRKKIGMIFQQFNLLSSKTVFGNVAMPLMLDRRPGEEIKKKVHELLTFVGLEDKAGHYPEQLSGGQKQRVGIARALATNPSILLCDEATSALDPETTSSVLALLKKIRADYGITILMITHEMNVIRDICDRVAVLDDGRIVEEESVLNLFSNPKTDIAKNFVRTVLNDEIPVSIQSLINEQNQFHRIYRIVFKGEATSQPLLSTIAKKFRVDVNVLHGTITELQGVPFGNLVVDFTGTAEEVERAIFYIHQQQVWIKEVLPNAV